MYCEENMRWWQRACKYTQYSVLQEDIISIT